MDLSIGLEGHINVTVRRADGSIRVQRQAQNAINANLKNGVAGYLFSSTNPIEVNRMTITYTQGVFSPISAEITSGDKTAAQFQCIYTETFTCTSVDTGQTEAKIQTVKLEKAASPNVEYASHTFSPEIDGIQASEEVTIAYTLRAGTATGVTDLLRESVATAFDGSGTFRRVQYLWSNGLTGSNLAGVKASPVMTDSSTSSGNQSLDTATTTATCSGGVIVIRNNVSGGSNNATMTSADATKAYLSNVSGTIPANDDAALAFAEITNVKQNDKLDLQFTLTIS